MVLDYVGAGSRLDPDRGLALDPDRWAWAPKIDGTYARVTTDARGAVASVIGRNGAPVREALDLVGILAGPPDAVLHGEFEAHTEAGVRAAAARGWANLHLFDCTRSRGRSLESLGYSARYGELHRAHALLELAGDDRREPMQRDPRTWTWDMPGGPLARWRRARASHHRLGRGVGARPVLPPRPWSPADAMVPGGPPRDLRRFPVVPLARGAGAGRGLWADFVERQGGEGVVAVRLDAPVAARGGKRKIKATDTLDCVVLEASERHARLSYGGRSFVVSAKGKTRPAPGQVVEVAHDGWYERGATPRFARILRVRPELGLATALGG